LTVFAFFEETFLTVKAHLGLATRGIGSVARKARLSQDRTDITVIVNLVHPLRYSRSTDLESATTKENGEHD
jgi:hypothetical protein